MLWGIRIDFHIVPENNSPFSTGSPAAAERDELNQEIDGVLALHDQRSIGAVSVHKQVTLCPMNIEPSKRVCVDKVWRLRLNFVR